MSDRVYKNCFTKVRCDEVVGWFIIGAIEVKSESLLAKSSLIYLMNVVIVGDSSANNNRFTCAFTCSKMLWESLIWLKKI